MIRRAQRPTRARPLLLRERLNFLGAERIRGLVVPETAVTTEAPGVDRAFLRQCDGVVVAALDVGDQREA